MVANSHRSKLARPPNNRKLYNVVCACLTNKINPVKCYFTSPTSKHLITKINPTKNININKRISCAGQGSLCVEELFDDW
jgi:hypothetical protein